MQLTLEQIHAALSEDRALALARAYICEHGPHSPQFIDGMKDAFLSRAQGWHLDLAKERELRRDPQLAGFDAYVAGVMRGAVLYGMARATAAPRLRTAFTRAEAA